MKHSKLTPVPKGAIAKRKGGNGGYSKRKPISDTKAVRRNRNAKDYHGNSTKYSTG